MHQYKIQVFNCSEDGEVNELLFTRYADNHEQARLICAEYEKHKYDNGKNMYYVQLYILCYKLVADKDSFFEQFNG